MSCSRNLGGIYGSKTPGCLWQPAYNSRKPAVCQEENRRFFRLFQTFSQPGPGAFAGSPAGPPLYDPDQMQMLHILIMPEQKILEVAEVAGTVAIFQVV